MFFLYIVYKNKSNIVNFVGAIEDISFEREKNGNIFQEK